ncbi:nucleotide sugar dehydrogenase [Listeria sp. PSOL-1]|uniref:nucleotide sugar dehydrogenase n=1 Tax=Listeria sp. PSOL-1 TaxID=1844999 RepID=UPI0013D573DE|nr:nucleotide sugar dehydrogenase [Listeria sp. PSOL-1]
MKINVIGLGYIGLPTAMMFASCGHQVVGVDNNAEIVRELGQGKIHIEEPGVKEILQSTLKKQTFKAAEKAEKGDVFIIAVPTPNRQDELHSCDLSYVTQAVFSILPFLEKGNTVIIESTIAPNTTAKYIAPILEQQGFCIGEDLFLVHCPERVLPGKIINELVYNNRIIGGVTPNCTKQGKAIYQTFVKGELIETDATTAELSKLMENTFRDVNIALANELVQISNHLEVNAIEVIKMANKHPRVNIHQPGPGVGGHCLAVDPYFIIATAEHVSPLIQQARAINSAMPAFVVQTIERLLDRPPTNATIALLGQAYKGNIDDKRESPAVEVFQLLKAQGYNLKVFDPHISDPSYEESLESATAGTDLVVILTDHTEFLKLNTIKVTAPIYDTRAFLNVVESPNLIYNFGNQYKYSKELVNIGD